MQDWMIDKRQKIATLYALVVFIYRFKKIRASKNFKIIIIRAAVFSWKFYLLYKSVAGSTAPMRTGRPRVLRHFYCAQQ